MSRPNLTDGAVSVIYCTALTRSDTSRLPATPRLADVRHRSYFASGNITGVIALPAPSRQRRSGAFPPPRSIKTPPLASTAAPLVFHHFLPSPASDQGPWRTTGKRLEALGMPPQGGGGVLHPPPHPRATGDAPPSGSGWNVSSLCYAMPPLPTGERFTDLVRHHRRQMTLEQRMDPDFALNNPN